MNVTVMVPKSLRPAVEGRAKVSLGLPPNANVGDLLETLFTLYPKLKQHVASEGAAAPLALTLVSADAQSEPIGQHRLRDGQVLYLAAAPVKRLAS